MKVHGLVEMGSQMNAYPARNFGHEKGVLAMGAAFANIEEQAHRKITSQPCLALFNRNP